MFAHQRVLGLRHIRVPSVFHGLQGPHSGSARVPVSASLRRGTASLSASSVEWLASDVIRH